MPHLATTVLAVAPNGARFSRSDHPRIPLTAAETVHACHACVDAGATMIHAHVRDAGGQHVLDAEAARAIERTLLTELGDRAVIQTTTEAVGRYTAAEQEAFLRAARPRAVSIAWREIERPDLDDHARERLFAWCVAERIAVQFIVYDPADLARLQEARARGILADLPLVILIVVGRYLLPESVADAPALSGFLPHCENVRWMACAFGEASHNVLLAASLLGGDVRIGLENGFTRFDGSVAYDNADLVRDFLAGIARHHRGPATIEETRRRLGLP